MCGIVGLFKRSFEIPNRELVVKLSDRLAHRGPDGAGVWCNPGIALAHRRLAIIDLSELASQPMLSEDQDFCLVFNGMIYNYKELRKELAANYSFRSDGDTEVLLRSYQQWGGDCVSKLNGMFAFAIWDQSKRKLFIARDRYGIKPLYYWDDGKTFIFASEIKAILEHPDVVRRVSIPALNEYFSFQNIFSDLTLFDGIKVLPPGHVLEVTGSGSKISQYWDFNFEEDFSLSEEETAERTKGLFEQAVSRQLVSDVELGMDSGSITAVAARKFPNLKTFTCGFDMSSVSGLEVGADERVKAEFLSNLYKTEHYEVVLKAGDMERVMPKLIWHLEDLRVGQCYPNYYVSKLASRFVKVVLAGTGGDELFAGYPWRYYRVADNLDFNDYADKYYKYWHRLIPDSLKSSFYRESIYPEILNYPTRDVFRSVLNQAHISPKTPAEYVKNALYFESKTFLHGLLSVEDKISMAHSLETRVPFLDNDLVDFAVNIPVSYSLKKMEEVMRVNENAVGLKAEQYYSKTNDGKAILRKVLSNYVPDQYVSGAKQGFSAPDGSWFKGESIEYIKQFLFSNNAQMYEYIQPETARMLMQEHFDGKVNRRLLIWSFLCFEWWLKTFFPK
jgi:asparagine synthase (glutamine-hydrolysing)